MRTARPFPRSGPAGVFSPSASKPRECRHARDHEGRKRRACRQGASQPRQGRRHRWRRGRLLDPVPPREIRLEGRASAGALRTHRGIVVARGGDDSHAVVGPEHLPAAGLHDQPLPRDRGDLGPFRRPEQDRRLLPRLHQGLVRLSQARTLQGALHGARPGVHCARRSRPASSADRPEALLRGPLGRTRRRPRSLWRDPCLRQVGPRPRRAVFHADAGGRDQPAVRRLVGRGHAARHGQRRADRELRRAVGARGGPHGRRRAAGAADGAPLPHHRAAACDRGADGGRRRRPPAGGHRLRGQHLFPPGAARHAARHLRAQVDALERRRHTRRFRPGAAAARSRPHRRPAGNVLRAHSRHRRGRDQGCHQRPLHLRPRRQSHDRPGAGGAELLGGGGRHGGLLPGRRRRADHGGVDDRRRALHRRVGHGCRPLRRVRDARVGHGQVVGELRAPLRDDLPQRDSAQGPAPEDHGAARPAGRQGRGDGPGIRARARALVRRRARRRPRGPLLPPLQGA